MSNDLSIRPVPSMGLVALALAMLVLCATVEVARAEPVVRFIEGPEGQPVTVQHEGDTFFQIDDPSSAEAGGGFGLFPTTAPTTPPNQNQLWFIVLFEDNSRTVISDRLTAVWQVLPDPSNPGANQVNIGFIFQSDSTESNPLTVDQINVTINDSAVENGLLQSFRIDPNGLNFLVQIQSDASESSVPEPASLVLLAVSSLALLGSRTRSRKA